MLLTLISFQLKNPTSPQLLLISRRVSQSESQGFAQQEFTSEMTFQSCNVQHQTT